MTDPENSYGEEADGEAYAFRSNPEEGMKDSLVGMIGEVGHFHFKDEQGDDDCQHSVAKSFDAGSAFNSL
jgi:hypothetical protein